MSGFQVHRGTTAVYDQDHVDTDRIIPARFLTMVTKTGYGEKLFIDVRAQEADFFLDRPEVKGASVLVVGTNFGCGSSREHAVWAIQQAGFEVVIARQDADSPGYSDIFRQNSANCGLLLVELLASDHAHLIGAGNGAECVVDLPNQTVSIGNHVAHFEINAATKEQLLAGLDLVGTTLQYESDISAYEKEWSSFSPASV